MSDLSPNCLTVLIWIFTGASIILTAGRYAIRLKIVKSFKADDYVHGLAMIFLIGYVSTYSAVFPLKYPIESWSVGLGKKPSDSDLERYIHLEFAVSLLFWIVVYLVKLAFLFFYRFLFGVSKCFLRAWWAVCMFTAVTFSINFIATFWICEAPRHLFVLGKCTSQRASGIAASILCVWCGLNVVSDLSIIILPLWVLQGLRMSMSRKVGLAIIFLIAISDVAFDITRTVYTVKGGTTVPTTIWDILEPTIAVIVSTLPTYKALLGVTKKKKNIRYQNLSHHQSTILDTKHARDASSISSTQWPMETHTKKSSTVVIEPNDTV